MTVFIVGAALQMVHGGNVKFFKQYFEISYTTEKVAKF